MGQSDSLCFGDQPKERTVAVEAPRPPTFCQFDPGLVMAVEQLVRDLPRASLVGQLEGFGTEPLRADGRNQRVRQDPSQGRVGLNLLELATFLRLSFAH
jgi:hypothetical protein